MDGPKKYIIGNWKSNKNRQETKDWFSFISKQKFSKKTYQYLSVVVCPPFPYLSLSRVLISESQLTIQLGAQDVSPFPNGAYTGEITAIMIKEYAEYVLIGHSERRKYFHEDDKLLAEKVTRAMEAGLKVVYCVPDEKTEVPQNVDLIAYEPVWAIGTGKADTPENASQVIGIIKQKYPQNQVIYGGSVTPENVVSFVSQSNIDGVLPGGASLDPVKFSQMVESISQI
ncbi:triose-phosphate isomerase [Candidatus Gottesmanbacteria bacterium RIFCSPHIGHO2_01_FULL_39_10]|uniref:Triosephosphate isomerase n=1 Tax=Candidatus Gottesmanbacteria bacterium RIFCSPHIGHO2_01_FULL_39_10 TaxID=1798375 RepID=A0A1F5ZQS4_9BACT|nr:MAG: triose-phosphate isomerase [Candidatus Gottesmanbacteria bacterium RIFCSPHIGHO2_01_FULL_39_10]